MAFVRIIWPTPSAAICAHSRCITFGRGSASSKSTDGLTGIDVERAPQRDRVRVEGEDRAGAEPAIDHPGAHLVTRLNPQHVPQVTGAPGGHDGRTVRPDLRGLEQQQVHVAGRRLHVELEEQHVAVGHDVFLTFHAVEPLFPGGGDGAAAHEVVVRHRLRFDETPLEV